MTKLSIIIFLLFLNFFSIANAKFKGTEEVWKGNDEFVIFKSPVHKPFSRGELSLLTDKVVSYCKQFNKETFHMGVYKFSSGGRPYYNMDLNIGYTKILTEYSKTRFICANSNSEANQILRKIYNNKVNDWIKFKTRFKKQINKNPDKDFVLISSINSPTLEKATALRKKEKEKKIAKKPENSPIVKQKPKIVDDGKIIKIGSGTGFIVSRDGHIISNNHVVGVCKKVMTYQDGKEIYLDILATDKINDLGLIKGKIKTKNVLSIKSDGAELGEDIVAFGYPLAQQLSDSVKLTKGIVSSLSGMDNNYSQIQIDAAIQPGNSGGPVMNMNGQVVGVASSGLSKLYMARKTKYIPENVNFAVAAPSLITFLKANKINFSSSGSFRELDTKDLAKIGKPATIQLFCMNTRTEYAKLKNAETHSDMLLDLD